ncbi:retinol dehydrogenase 7-like isoform X1 [Alligator sinensis]|uniref:Retinol dehydrogenase 7-like isoform X1 n=1 Tax=Alligator sinensis TaxID=38654 RepID=A0A1U8DUL8_ALLSI|nr:retinol dehydrogenase 7-like isoform X1 [Alligator sinensis]
MWLYLVALLALYLLRRWYRERQMVRNLPDKHVFITGCDSGFGHLLAKQLDGRGLRVLAACLTEQGAERLRQETSGRLQTVILDVTKSDSITAAAAWVKVQVGDRGKPSVDSSQSTIRAGAFAGLHRECEGLWGLVNNAGIGAPTGPNEFLSKADFVKVLDVNLVGLIEVTLSLLPLVRRAQGRIVNVASVMGRLAVFGGGYGPSKYGVEAFSDSLRRELRDFRVKVSIIEPGGFRTPILDVQRVQKSLEQVWSCASANVKEAYGQQYLDCCIEKLKELLFTTSPKLHLVTDAMEHALTARHPRTRYSCGWDAKLFYLPVSYLPTSWADYLLTCSTPKPAQGI